MGLVGLGVSVEKRVDTVLLLFSFSAHLSVQSLALLMVSWILLAAVDVCSEALHTAKSSACRVLETCFGMVDVMSFT